MNIRITMNDETNNDEYLYLLLRRISVQHAQIFVYSSGEEDEEIISCSLAIGLVILIINYLR
jgi:hypothetical protein